MGVHKYSIGCRFLVTSLSSWHEPLGCVYKMLLRKWQWLAWCSSEIACIREDNLHGCL